MALWRKDMELWEYKMRSRCTYRELADKIGCSSNHLNQIAVKRFRPGKTLAKMIEKITDGQVTVEELLSGYTQAKSERELARARRKGEKTVKNILISKQGEEIVKNILTQIETIAASHVENVLMQKDEAPVEQK